MDMWKIIHREERIFVSHSYCCIQLKPSPSSTGRGTKNIKDCIQQQWLHQYPRPNPVIFDHGGELESSDFYSLCLECYSYQFLSMQSMSKE
jgi:hypothetical protein